ncbi:unnamed protein product [Cylindrotheca closterium]|uniref:Uncharacterized protein n=1 Tax=Cylindrotheca closterium TaxID=2856 RepID=A0AAD2PW59_9STRA|nr:unnamed protein product [Cylindrotheca closterium]
MGAADSQDDARNEESKKRDEINLNQEIKMPKNLLQSDSNQPTNAKQREDDLSYNCVNDPLEAIPGRNSGSIHPSRLSMMHENLDHGVLQKENPAQYVSHPSRLAVMNENQDHSVLQKESPMVQEKVHSDIEASTCIGTGSTRISHPGAFYMGEMTQFESLNEAVTNGCGISDISSDSSSTENGSSNESQLIIVPRASVVGKSGDYEEATSDRIFNIPVVYAVRNGPHTTRRRTFGCCGVLGCLAIVALLWTVIHMLLEGNQAVLSVPVYITNAPTPALEHNASNGNDTPVGSLSTAIPTSPNSIDTFIGTQAPSEAKGDIFAFPSPSPMHNDQPVPSPNRSPTRNPTPEPTSSSLPEWTPNPTARPTRFPTPGPTPGPTPEPTRRAVSASTPTRNPTRRPTRQPTRATTPRPTLTPTRQLTPRPAPRPSPNPTRRPAPNPEPRPPPPDGDRNGGGGSGEGGGDGGGGGGGGNSGGGGGGGGGRGGR